jgi:NAD(P)-dependent dehydrogenase (short-subunit alcohol dehydrogenase family)
MIETSAGGRVGTPDEVAAAAAFLLGPKPASSPAATC